MFARFHQTDDSAVQTCVNLFNELLAGYKPRNFAVRFWNGETIPPDEGQKALFTIVIKHSGALREMLWPPGELKLCEAYIYGDFDVEGDIESAVSFGNYVAGLETSLAEKIHYGKMIWSLPRDKWVRKESGRAARLSGAPHSKKRDMQANSYHYDVSNEFYSLWLDKKMVYSCAYFESPKDDIDTAQERKLDFICKKLRLVPDYRLIDIGCGWGTLIMHAAKNHGVNAVGITLSRRQYELANEMIKEAGLQDRCGVELMDYRDAHSLGLFDRAVSVGMIEHVGEKMMPEYFEQVYRILRPGGVFLNHGITCPVGEMKYVKSDFSLKYVFPDGELLPIDTVLREADASGFEVRDVESLREHYALTLRSWIKRLEVGYKEAVRLTSETTYRVWRLYMAVCAHRFARRRLNVYQSLLVKPDGGESEFPLTRNYLYENGRQRRIKP